MFEREEKNINQQQRFKWSIENFNVFPLAVALRRRGEERLFSLLDL